MGRQLKVNLDAERRKTQKNGLCQFLFIIITFPSSQLSRTCRCYRRWGAFRTQALNLQRNSLTWREQCAHGRNHFICADFPYQTPTLSPPDIPVALNDQPLTLMFSFKPYLPLLRLRRYLKSYIGYSLSWLSADAEVSTCI